MGSFVNLVGILRAQGLTGEIRIHESTGMIQIDVFRVLDELAHHFELLHRAGPEFFIAPSPVESTLPCADSRVSLGCRFEREACHA